MGIEIKPGAKRWYGRFREGDRIRQFPLNTGILGPGGGRPETAHNHPPEAG